MPWPSSSVAQMQLDVDVPLLDPHVLSHAQLESQGGRAHTPLTQSNPSLQALPQLPQFARSFFVSVHLPLHWLQPGPVQVGVLDGGVVVDVVVEFNVTLVAVFTD
jgi:hypothetical protein